VDVGSGAVTRMLYREVGKAFMRWAAYTGKKTRPFCGFLYYK